MERFIINKEETLKDIALTWKYGNRIYQIADRSQLLYISGNRGAFKSSLARAIIASAYNKDGVLGYRYKSNGKAITLIDSETPPMLLNRHMLDFLKMANLSEVPKNLNIFRLNTIPDPIERRDKVLEYIEKEGNNLDLLIIDLPADLVLDESSVIESNLIINSISALVDTKEVLCCVTSHTNDSGELLNTLGRKIGRKSRSGLSLLKTRQGVIVQASKTSFEPLPTSEIIIGANRELIAGDYIPFSVFEKQKIY